MILYHGTNLNIDSIDLAKCRPYKDFGRGFYLTSIQTQAKSMAARVSKIYGGNPIINIYEIEDNFLLNEELSIKNFGTEVSGEWADFVMNNRDKFFGDIKNEACNLDCKYDIVAGPVANDDLATLFREYRRHMITQQTFLDELTYKRVTNQISFHTGRAISLLQKRGVIV